MRVPNKINRVEVIDHTENGEGRVYVKHEKKLKVSVDIQDDGRTMKIFINDQEVNNGSWRNNSQKNSTEALDSNWANYQQNLFLLQKEY